MSNENRKYFHRDTNPAVLLAVVDQENLPLVLQPDGSAKFIVPDGKKTAKYQKLSYEQMKTGVGGLIEYVHFKHNKKQRHMIANEEGIIHGMPYNPLASKMVASAGYEGIVGPVIILPGSRKA